mgnify:CR=1 FL=1
MKFEDMDLEVFTTETGVHVVPQISPKVLSGGDCGYCCLAGLLGVSVPVAYEITESRMPKGFEGRASMCAWRWRFLLQSFGLPGEEYRPKHYYYKSGAIPMHWDNRNWIDGVRDVVAAGDVLVASVRFNRGAPPPPHTPGDSDHNVLITGYKQHWLPHPTMAGAASQSREVLISCSAKGESWIPWDELLYWHGAYPAFVVPVAALRQAYARDTRCPVEPRTMLYEG